MKENEIFSPTPLFRPNVVSEEISSVYKYQNKRIYLEINLNGIYRHLDRAERLRDLQSMMTYGYKGSSYLQNARRYLDYARYKEGRKQSFLGSIRTPFDVLLTFVPMKQMSLHYLSFRQTVAQQEGYLASKQARPANRGLEKPLALNLYSNYRIYIERNSNNSYAISNECERSTVYDDMHIIKIKLSK